MLSELLKKDKVTVRVNLKEYKGSTRVKELQNLCLSVIPFSNFG